ncbi:MAG: hypothetical protein KIT43_04640, partial [Bauldia sp.]|nr:hypothetical protein [Bauldia sp.]
MIYFVTHHDTPHPIATAASVGRKEGLADIRLLTYRALFTKRRAPVGHYVFTDFDRLTSYEIEAAEILARRLVEAAPRAKILNRPAMVLERFALLRRLAAAGLNDFSAYRIDSGDMPQRYPVFIRLEDDCQKPDTALLHSEGEYRAAITALQAAGLPIKRRIAVEYCAESNADGYFRKYGVFRIGDRLVPHHLFHNGDWYVKFASRQRVAEEADPFAPEIIAYLENLPHAAEVMQRFEMASIDYGRIDYGFAAGRLQTYEINTNPLVPFRKLPPSTDLARIRRVLFRQRFFGAFAALDTPVAGPSTIRFALPEPHREHFPTGLDRLHAALNRLGLRRPRFGDPQQDAISPPRV